MVINNCIEPEKRRLLNAHVKGKKIPLLENGLHRAHNQWVTSCLGYEQFLLKYDLLLHPEINEKITLERQACGSGQSHSIQVANC